MFQPMPAADELITRFIQSPHNPALLQEEIAALVASGPEQANYVENKLQAWFTEDSEKILSAAGIANISPAPLKQRNTTLWITAAVVLVLAAVMLFCFRKPARKLISHTNSSGHIDSLILSDGSRIVLNKNAAISFDSTNDNNFFAEIVTGDVFFMLAPGVSCTVKTSADHRLHATSAAFNVHRSARNTQVFVANGKVTVTGGGEGDVELSPAMLGTLMPQKKTGRKVMESEAPLAWRTGVLSFHNVCAEEVLNAVSTYYDIEIAVPPSAMKLYKKKLTVDFRKKSEKETIAQLQKALAAHLVKDSTDIYYLTLK